MRAAVGLCLLLFFLGTFEAEAKEGDKIGITTTTILWVSILVVVLIGVYLAERKHPIYSNKPVVMDEGTEFPQDRGAHPYCTATATPVWVPGSASYQTSVEDEETVTVVVEDPGPSETESLSSMLRETLITLQLNNVLRQTDSS